MIHKYEMEVEITLMATAVLNTSRKDINHFQKKPEILLHDFFVLFDALGSSFKEVQRRKVTLHDFIHRD